jgi:hypothetical protein
MAGGKLLFGEPEAFFSEIYVDIEAYLTAQSLPYHALTPLHNVRSGVVTLDERNSIGPMAHDTKDDPRWKDVAWDSSYELPAQFEHRFELPVLPEGVHGDIQLVHNECRLAVEDALISIAISQRSTATAGPMLVESIGFVPQRASTRMPGSPPREDLAKTLIDGTRVAIMTSAWTALRRDPRSRIRLVGERLASIELARDDDDALLEAVTALEAILGDDARNELAHRLSLLAARLVAADLGLSQRDVRDGIFKAFQRRTTVLRGRGSSESGEASRSLLRLVDDVVRRLTHLRVANDPRLSSDPIDAFLTDA